MFFSALDRTRRGIVACVFDTTDGSSTCSTAISTGVPKDGMRE